MAQPITDVTFTKEDYILIDRFFADSEARDAILELDELLDLFDSSRTIVMANINDRVASWAKLKADNRILPIIRESVYFSDHKEYQYIPLTTIDFGKEGFKVQFANIFITRSFQTIDFVDVPDDVA